MDTYQQQANFACIILLFFFSLSGCKNGPEITISDKYESSNLSKIITPNGYISPGSIARRENICCFDLFVNVCDPSIDNEHFVGKGTIKLYNREGGDLLWEDEDGFDDGKIGTICFVDNPDDQSDTYYIEIVLNNSFLNGSVKYSGTVPVSELLKYHVLPQWDTSMNALHIQLCPGKDDCFFGQYICNTTKGRMI